MQGSGRKHLAWKQIGRWHHEDGHRRRHPTATGITLAIDNNRLGADLPRPRRSARSSPAETTHHFIDTPLHRRKATERARRTEGARPCQWVLLPGLAGCWACVTGLSCSPVAAVSGRGAGGSRTGLKARPHWAPEASLRAAGPGSPMMCAVGERERSAGCYLVVQVRPIAGFPGAASAAGCAHPSPGLGRGARRMGRSASVRAIRRGQSRSAHAGG
jgi:hypothetical protein